MSAPDRINRIENKLDHLIQEVALIKTELAVNKAEKRLVKWILFTVMPALGSALTWVGIKIGFYPA